jgi:tetratricopeptide (TPR) repeat protein
VQLAAGKVAEAEATVKRAIAIDPSDGEQPKGDRMRAYAVLRDVALAKKDAKQAEFLAGVIAAIRRSEDADDIAAAGLIDRAIKEYELALESFSDAYCIQSRLARQLAEENRLAEAAEHYKRAFELMPDSFGRVESHCFGCEQAFAGEDAQAIAERVFTEMAAKPDAKPQVHYLLGYLRMEQERWEESAAYFTKAVTADPDYLNAWKKLADVLPNTLRPRAEQDRVAFRLLALDPAGKHGGAGDQKVRDLPSLWRAYAASVETGLVAPEKLFPLGEKAKKGKARGNDYTGQMNRNETPKAPAERLARHDVLEGVIQALDTLHEWRVSAD